MVKTEAVLAVATLFISGTASAALWTDEQIVELFKNHPVVAKALKAKSTAGYNIEFNFVVLSEKCQLNICSKDLLATMTASSSNEATSLSAVIRQVSSPDVVPE